MGGIVGISPKGMYADPGHAALSKQKKVKPIFTIGMKLHMSDMKTNEGDAK